MINVSAVVTLIVALVISDDASAWQSRGRTAMQGQAYTQDPGVTAYRNAFTTNKCVVPTGKWMRAIANFITSEKGVGNDPTTTRDMVYVLESTDSCTISLNIAQPTLYKITWGGTGVFSVQGYGGDGAAAAGDTGVNHSALTRITQNNGQMYAWVAANKNFIAGLNGVTTGFQLKNSTSKFTAINNIQANGCTDGTGGLVGLNGGERTSSSNIATYNNGVVQTASCASISAALIAAHVMICQISSNFCVASAQIKFFSMGAATNNVYLFYVHTHDMLRDIGGGV